MLLEVPAPYWTKVQYTYFAASDISAIATVIRLLDLLRDIFGVVPLFQV